MRVDYKSFREHNCKSRYIYGEYGEMLNYCGNCGQKLEWSEEEE